MEQYRMLFAAISVALSCLLGIQCFPCYQDICEAGHQYCVEERQRCYHCKDLERPCDNQTMLPDCEAFCVERELRQQIQNLQRRINDLTDLKENVTIETGVQQNRFRELERNHSSSRQELEEYRDSVKIFKTSLWVSVTANVCLMMISISLTVTILCQRKTKAKTTKQEEIELLDDDVSSIENKSSSFHEKRRSGDSALGSTFGGSTGFDDVIRDEDQEHKTAGLKMTQTYGDISIGIQERGVSTEPQDEPPKSTLVCGPSENEQETNFINCP